MEMFNLVTLLENRFPNVRTEKRLFLDYAFEAGLVSDKAVPGPNITGEFEAAYRLMVIGYRAFLAYLLQQDK